MATQIDKATHSDAAEPLASVPLWIGGQRTSSRSSRSGNVTNASTGKVVRTVPFANADDIDAAVKAATAAFPEWRATPPLRRARILTRFRELMEQHQKELAAIVSEEHGKVFLDAMGSVQRGIEVIEFAAGAPHLLKGEHAGSVGRGVDAHSRCSRSASAPASRRSTSR
jgi:malonate-semialdehyde dehydrogenase (acetylating)/methylmalonate-semialdehyde dehydrogenase